MVERQNKKTGQSFYGCSGYPACKFAVASLDRLKPPSAEPLSPSSNAGEGELAAAVRDLADAIRVLAGARAEHKPEEKTTL